MGQRLDDEDGEMLGRYLPDWKLGTEELRTPDLYKALGAEFLGTLLFLCVCPPCQQRPRSPQPAAARGLGGPPGGVERASSRPSNPSTPPEPLQEIPNHTPPPLFRARSVRIGVRLTC